MISRATRSFWQAYEGLNATQKRAARRAFTLFLQDPDFHNDKTYLSVVGFLFYYAKRRRALQ